MTTAMNADSVLGGQAVSETRRDIPGRDCYDELFHLLRDPTRFFHLRFERYGRVFKSRLICPRVFGGRRRSASHAGFTKRAEFSFGGVPCADRRAARVRK